MRKTSRSWQGKKGWKIGQEIWCEHARLIGTAEYLIVSVSLENFYPELLYYVPFWTHFDIDFVFTNLIFIALF